MASQEKSCHRENIFGVNEHSCDCFLGGRTLDRKEVDGGRIYRPSERTHTHTHSQTSFKADTSEVGGKNKRSLAKNIFAYIHERKWKVWL